MTGLLGSLVERSVRAASAASADRGPLSSDAATSRDRAGALADHSPPGALMPRRRSRYERQTAEPELDIAEESADATAHALPAEPQPHGPEAPIAVRRAPAERQRVAHAASDDAPHHAAVEPVSRPQPAEASPVAVPAAAPLQPPAAPPVMDSAELAVKSSTSSPRQTLPQPGSISPARHDVAAAAAPPPERSSTGELAAVPPPRPAHAPVAQIAAPPAAVLPAEPAVRRGELAPVRPRDPLRETARRSDPSGPQPSIAKPAPPSVRVSIGRVEVRAVFASPPSPARRPAAAPAMALDDYLKQREKGS